jgi:hypothetical protein
MPTNEENELNHQDILVNIEKSKDGVYKAAQWLNSKGFTVAVPPVVAVQCSYEERMKYVDGGDLFVQQRVEVKVRNIDFTCKEDFPYKKGMLVCAQHSFDNAKPKPYAYIYLNKQMTHIALIMSSTSKQWIVKSVKDSRYRDFVQPTYECPLELVSFYKI